MYSQLAIWYLITPHDSYFQGRRKPIKSGGLINKMIILGSSAEPFPIELILFLLRIWWEGGLSPPEPPLPTPLVITASVYINP